VSGSSTGISCSSSSLSKVASSLCRAPPRARCSGGSGSTRRSECCAAAVSTRSCAAVRCLDLVIGWSPEGSAARCGPPTTRSPGQAGLGHAKPWPACRTHTHACRRDEVERNVWRQGTTRTCCGRSGSRGYWMLSTSGPQHE
jgi:hypothetical protein